MKLFLGDLKKSEDSFFLLIFLIYMSYSAGNFFLFEQKIEQFLAEGTPLVCTIFSFSLVSKIDKKIVVPVEMLKSDTFKIGILINEKTAKRNISVELLRLYIVYYKKIERYRENCYSSINYLLIFIIKI